MTALLNTLYLGLLIAIYYTNLIKIIEPMPRLNEQGNDHDNIGAPSSVYLAQYLLADHGVQNGLQLLACRLVLKHTLTHPPPIHGPILIHRRRAKGLHYPFARPSARCSQLMSNDVCIYHRGTPLLQPVCHHGFPVTDAACESNF